MSARSLIAIVGACLAWLVAGAVAAGTLDTVRERGQVLCGVGDNLPGFSVHEADGTWSGLEADICRAIAAAIFGDANKTVFVPLTAAERFPALQSGEIDILARNTTTTLSSDARLGFDFAPVVFYDGQGFLVHKSSGATMPRELDGATLCIPAINSCRLNIDDFFQAQGLTYRAVVSSGVDEAMANFMAGECQALVADRSLLASLRARAPEHRDEFVLFEDIVSKEPMAPVLREDDSEWFDLVTWVIYALIEAEELGIAQSNISMFADSDRPNVQRLLGLRPGLGEALGLEDSWAHGMISQVGNYGEIYERNLGAGSALQLDRGLNDLWTRGGLMYALPVR